MSSLVLPGWESGLLGKVLAIQGYKSKSDFQNQGKGTRYSTIIPVLGKCPGQQYNLRDRKLKTSTKKIKGKARSYGTGLSPHIQGKLTQEDHKFKVSTDYRVSSSEQLRIILSISKGGLGWGSALEEHGLALPNTELNH